jgi:hypothetical protein
LASVLPGAPAHLPAEDEPILEQAAASLGKTVKAHKPYWAAMARLDVTRTFKLSSRLIVQGPAWAHCDGRHELVMNRDDG